jgi:hypothetical protein
MPISSPLPPIETCWSDAPVPGGIVPKIQITQIATRGNARGKT